MILARPFLGSLDIGLLTIAFVAIAFCVIRKNWRTWLARIRGWWGSRKSKKKQ